MDSTVTILVKTGFSSVRSELKKCAYRMVTSLIFYVQAEDGIRYLTVTGVQTCALPIYPRLRIHQTPAVPCLVLLDLVRQRGARPDERHLPAQHVPQLRQLVEARLAEHAADRRHARIGGDLEESGWARLEALATRLDELRHVLAMERLIRAGIHGAELQHREGLHLFADARLSEEQRPGRATLDEQRDQQEQRRQEDQQRDAAEHVHDPFDRATDLLRRIERRRRGGGDVLRNPMDADLNRAGRVGPRADRAADAMLERARPRAGDGGHFRLDHAEDPALGKPADDVRVARRRLEHVHDPLPPEQRLV